MTWATRTTSANATQNKRSNNHSKPAQHVVKTNYQNKSKRIIKKYVNVADVILDSGAFINRRAFFNDFSADTNYYITPDIEQEVMDKHSRQFLQSFPFEIKIKEPLNDSVQYVFKFIKKNKNNLSSLSKIDRQIIALTHTLEVEKEGTANIASIHNIHHHARKQQQQNQKRQTQMNNLMLNHNQNNHNQNNHNQKKSKTKKVAAQPKLADTGFRIADGKKVIPLHFNEFMTMNEEQYGDKYGKPIDYEALLRTMQESIELENKEQKEEEQQAQQQQQPPLMDDKHDHTNNANTAANAIAMEDMNTQVVIVTSAVDTEDIKSAEDSTAAVVVVVASPSPSSSSTTPENEIEIENEIDIEIPVEKPLTKSQKRNRRRNRRTKQQRQQASNHAKQTNVADLNAFQHLNNSNGYDEYQQINANIFGSDVVISKSELDEVNSMFGTAIIDYGKMAAEAEEEQQRSMHIEMLTVNDAWNGEWLTPENYDTSASSQTHPQFGNFGNDSSFSRNNRSKNSNKIVSIVDEDLLCFHTDNHALMQPKQTQTQKQKQKHKTQESCVACLTSDLVIQRCLIGMGLRVLSTSADRDIRLRHQAEQKKRARKQKQNPNQNKSGNRTKNGFVKKGKVSDMDVMSTKYVFRCFACFQMENNTNRVFCKHCGSKAYQRVAIYTDMNGKQHYRYYYRDRYAQRYLDKHSLVPRGSQLVKYKGSDVRQAPYFQNRKKKKRSSLNNNTNRFKY